MRSSSVPIRVLFVALLGLAWAGCAGPARLPPPDGPCNVVLIVADDHGWSQLATPMDPRVPEASSAYLETPHLSRLAAAGMRFSDGYAPAPNCTPTRRSILCGTSAARSGTEFVSTWRPALHLTLPKALALARPGIRTAHFGKWGGDMGASPAACGYDVSDGWTTNDTGGMPATLREPLGRYRWHHNGPPHFLDEVDPKRTGSVTDRAIGFLREQATAEQPFYLQVSYYAVHLSIMCRAATLARFAAKGEPDRRYSAAWAAMLAELDAAVGRLLDAIDGLGLAGSTYVVFMADNGGRWSIPGADPSLTPTNAPLLGAKQSLYEGGIRVPFLVRGPGVAPGSVCRRPVVGYDLLPTFYELCGGPGVRASDLAGAVDGVSFRSQLYAPGATLERPGPGIVFHRPRRLESALRRGPYKLMLHWSRDGSIASRSLYAVGAEPREQLQDIVAAHPDLAGEMEADLLGFLREVGAETAPDFADR